MAEVKTMTIPVKFTKCFYKENISKILDKNSHFEEQENYSEEFKIYKYIFDDTERFDKILSLVAVFAIISVFKDGSDLLLSFIDAIKNAGSFSASNLVSLISPVLSVIVIFVLIKIFNKRK